MKIDENRLPSAKHFCYLKEILEYEFCSLVDKLSISTEQDMVR